jgi:hypothetical protein
MKNKNVIRKKLENGKFTTVHNSILFDTRLTPNALRLFIAILSDSDTEFNLSQTLYCNRLGITKKTFFSAIANLEECGYLRKSPTNVKNLFHYTISEYGNLNNDNDIAAEEESSTETDSDSNAEIKQMPDEYYDRLRPFYNKYNYLMCDDYYNNVFNIDLNKGEDYDIIIEKFEKYLYKKVIAAVTNSDENPKAFEDFKVTVKNLIFNHKNYDANFMNTWTVYKLTKYKKQPPRDHETEMSDYYENPKD